MTKLIHILQAGLALCGRRGAPVTWASHESWVGLQDAHLATCRGCIDATGSTAFELKRKGKRP